jgi:alkylation response protein AidB-like acyl-CoA dehydrogenase
MPQYRAPLRDIQFVLHELLEVEKHYDKLEDSEGLGRDTVDEMLGALAKFTEEVLSPLNRTGDEEGCTLKGVEVSTPKGFKEAYKTYCENGYNAIASDAAYGGQGLPPSLGIVASEMVGSANTSFAMYPGLTMGAITALQAHGTEEQKQTYLPKMNSGVWSGTMCLTEPHCGTDLGLLRTKAEPVGDGTYKLTGEKIFISAGEHDMTENIVHLVLARLPDAPAGTRGISLFLVPKFNVNADGSVGSRNTVKCGALEHKMGIKASATCVLVFEDAVGTLIGEPHKGLRCMFTMMNVARIGTGMQGMSQGELAYQGALTYAKERLQMRSLTGPKFPDKPADPIIVHPDVRRMLLTQKVIAEGSRAMAYYCGVLADLSRWVPTTEEGKRAEELLELLTPICKGFMTDTGSESCNLGVQVFGGHGYIREHGMEQLIRDGRVLQIYEGANGIQALDLLGRKVLATGGARLKIFTDEIEEFCKANEGNAALAEYINPLRLHVLEWHQLVQAILEKAIKNPDEAGAASYDFLSYSGYVCYAYFFARMAVVAQAALAKGSNEKAFYESKLTTARFYFRRVLPRTRSLKETMLSTADDMMSLPVDHFAF